MNCKEKSPTYNAPRQESGISLIIVTIGALVISLMIGSFSLYVKNRVDSRTIQEFKKNREVAYKTLLQSARDANALLISAQNSSDLNNCILRPNDCPIKAPANRRRFPLYSLSTSSQAQLTANNNSSISGMFNRFGSKNCNSTANCAMIGVTEFWLDCVPGQDCADKGFIKIRVEVKRNPGWNPSGSVENGLAKMLSNMEMGSRVSGGERSDGSSRHDEDVSLSIAELRRVALQKCPVGAWLVKLDEKGRAICKCSGFYEQDPTDRTKCRLFGGCPSILLGNKVVKTIWVGMETVVDPQGHTITKPKCEPADSFQNTCKIVRTTGGRNVSFTCPTRGFITKAYPDDECTVPPNTRTKRGDQPVSCPPWTITCCNLP
jgi:hypothetical protein